MKGWRHIWGVCFLHWLTPGEKEKMDTPSCCRSHMLQGWFSSHCWHHLFCTSNWWSTKANLEFVLNSWKVYALTGFFLTLETWALPSFFAFGRLSDFVFFWTFEAGCHLVSGFVFHCSSVEQYWDNFAKQRNTVTTVVEQRSHEVTQNLTITQSQEKRDTALSFL